MCRWNILQMIKCVLHIHYQYPWSIDNKYIRINTHDTTDTTKNTSMAVWDIWKVFSMRIIKSTSWHCWRVEAATPKWWATSVRPLRNISNWGGMAMKSSRDICHSVKLPLNKGEWLSLNKSIAIASLLTEGPLSCGYILDHFGTVWETAEHFRRFSFDKYFWEMNSLRFIVIHLDTFGHI